MSILARTKRGPILEDSGIARLLFKDPILAPLWLVLRLYLAYEWLEAGLHKVQDPAWMSTGVALKGFWTKAVVVPNPPAKPAITYDWYRTFLQSLLDGGHYVWFAKLVAVGEVLIGVALVLGIFVGIAAFFGAMMNFNFMLAGSASTNPMLFLVAVFLILAWKTAGWWGADRWLLVRLGTPWKPGKVFQGEQGRAPSPAPSRP